MARSVGGRDSATFHPDRSKCIADRHGYSGAGSGREVKRAGLLIYSGLQHHIASACERGVRSPHQCDPGGAPSLQVRENVQKFAGLTAVLEQKAYIVRCYDAEVAMQCIEGVEIEGHQADRGEGGGSFPGHDSTFTYTRDYEFGLPIRAISQKGQGVLDLIAVQTFRGCGDGPGLFL